MNENGFHICMLARASSVNTRCWVESLVSAGLRVTVLTIHPADVEGAEVLPLVVRGLPRKLAYLAAVLGCRRLVSRLRPDLVLAYDAGGYGALGALSGYRPLAVAAAGSDVLVKGPRPLSGLTRRFALRRADLVVAWAGHVAEAAVRLGVRRERIFVLPRGIPFERFRQARVQREANAPFRFVSTRSLAPQYRTDRLLAALAELENSGLNWSCTLAGEGPERAALIAQRDRLGLRERVRFAGWVPNDDVPALLAVHDGYVSLSATDGVSASLLEAMAAGLVPLAADNAANREWITPARNGLLFERCDARSLAQVLSAMATDRELQKRCRSENPEIVGRRADMRTNGRLFAERFRRLARGGRDEGAPTPSAKHDARGVP